jgi:hypothetical protein
MTLNALLFAGIAGLLTFVFTGGMSELLLTNILLGLISGKLMDKK